eukprot:TRINITY_DN7316_c0_g1_i1.p1 TRINITY_DN7316_c0_g1~~TRINITY_DN7316_c0_g1_i1.p1  ORF type:complete len:154 (+),score=21.16 TRINITY_DN7316_c0_g1_i1:170-631(+)
MAHRIAQAGWRKSSAVGSLSNLNSPNKRFRSSGGPWGEEIQVLEVDLASVEGEENFGVKRLEEAIHAIAIRRSAPDWLPFLPGSSYWIPPRKSNGRRHLVDLLGNLRSTMTKEECLSLNSERGWPSSEYFLQGKTSFPVDVVAGPKKPEDEEA